MMIVDLLYIRPCSDTKIRAYFQFDRILSFPTGPNAERRSPDRTSVAEVRLGPVMVCELAEPAGKPEPAVPDWSDQQLNPNMEVQCFTNSFPPLNSLFIEKNCVYMVHECVGYVWYVLRNRM